MKHKSHAPAPVQVDAARRDVDPDDELAIEQVPGAAADLSGKAGESGKSGKSATARTPAAARARTSPSPIAVIVVIVAVYLAVAEIVNRYLEADVLPTAWTMIPKLNPKRVYRTLTPQWLRNTIGLIIGGVLGSASRRR